MPKKLLAGVTLLVALAVTGCAQGRALAVPEPTAPSTDEQTCESTTIFEWGPESGSGSRVEAIQEMISALRAHPDAPELEYASREDVLLVLETAVSSLGGAEKLAGEASSANGYLEVPVVASDGEHLGQVNIADHAGRFVIDAIAVSHIAGKSCVS